VAFAKNQSTSGFRLPMGTSDRWDELLRQLSEVELEL